VLTIRSVTPLFAKAFERIRTAATVITAGCPKPLKASLAGITPRKTPKSMAPKATTS